MSEELLWVLLRAFMLSTLALVALCSWQAWALRRIRQVQDVDREQLRDAWRVVDECGARHELKRPFGVKRGAR